MKNLLGYSFMNWLIETGDLGEGPGLWCPLHIILMVALALWIVLVWIVFKRHKEFALKCTKVVCILMISFRIGRMLLLMISGKETVVQALPWHLCHVMAIVFPLFFFTKTKKFFLPIICVTFFGGILTFIFGDYYKYSVLSFLQIESLFLHFCMPTVVAGVLASGYFKIKSEDLWQIPVLCIMLVLWSSLGNALVPGANYLYLKSNGLPFNLFGNAHFYWTYLVLVIIMAVVFFTPIIVSKIVSKCKMKKIRDKVRNNLVNS